MKIKTITNKPAKGYNDWFPEEFRVRKYIFDVWRKVCQKYNYSEYLPPLLESADLYRTKSGEDIGGPELMTLTDRGGRELAIRPEMTPSVTRMVSRIYQSEPKPIRYFSIANFLRNQKPQRGRNREFWQLNYDIFGTDSTQADLEIIEIALNIMLSFSPPPGSFIVHINNRKLINTILIEKARIAKKKITDVARVLDKWEKLNDQGKNIRLQKLGLDNTQIVTLEKFMKCKSAEALIKSFPSIKKSKGFQTVQKLMKSLSAIGYKQWISFDPSIIRGFDYYDGTVFEVFDTHPDNNRSLFGGGRYNGLASIFGKDSFPAVGCAPGDETIRLFLESWDLVPNEDTLSKYHSVFIPCLSEKYGEKYYLRGQEIRKMGYAVEVSLDLMDFNKAFEYADKHGFDKVLILGDNEIADGTVSVKNMKNGKQVCVNMNELEKKLRDN